MESVNSCPACGRSLIPESDWHGANYCRGLFLMAFIAERPGLSAWELSGLSGLSYAQCSKGLQKLRDIEAVKYEAEERESGGIRYRFYPKEDYEVQRDRVAEMGHAYATLKEYRNQ